MTVLSRGARVRRGGRRPGWPLLTALLVLAIAASSALVFTNRVELLKLAVILALWAAVVAAFVSMIYRRQSDADQARARDLKLVYDLQLDREISARREYELTVESQLRRELASELHAQAADEVAALRAELAALRTNLEILFDADLGDRPALETERTTVRAYSDWAHDSESVSPERASDDRFTSVRLEDTTSRTSESPIIDVPEVGVPVVAHRQAGEDAAATYRSAESYSDAYRGSHRRPSEEGGWLSQERRDAAGRQRPWPEPEPEPAATEPELRFEPRFAQPPPQPPATGPATNWEPVRTERGWPATEAPRDNWASASSDNGSVPRDGSAEAAAPPDMPRGRHYSEPESAAAPPGATEPDWQYGQAGGWAARHSTDPRGDGVDAGAPPPPPPSASPLAARHRSADESSGPRTGGQSVAELLARLQTGPTAGGRRRRRED